MGEVPKTGELSIGREENNRSVVGGYDLMCKVNQRQISCKLGHSQFEDHTWDVMLGIAFMLTLNT